MSFTYSQLKQAIQDYAENTETSFVSNLPVFIRNAEERILKTVQLTEFRRNVTANVTLGNRFLSMPSDYLSTYSLSITSSGDKFFWTTRMLISWKSIGPIIPIPGALVTMRNFLLLVLHWHQRQTPGTKQSFIIFSVPPVLPVWLTVKSLGFRTTHLTLCYTALLWRGMFT